MNFITVCVGLLLYFGARTILAEDTTTMTGMRMTMATTAMPTTTMMPTDDMNTTSEPSTTNMNHTTSDMNTTTTNVTMATQTTESDDNMTTAAMTTVPFPAPGRYAVNGTDGTCILMQFYAVIDIPYVTNGGENDSVSAVVQTDSIPTGNCSTTNRTFQVTFKDSKDWFMRYEFTATDDEYTMTSFMLQWKYEEPYFPQDATKFGAVESFTRSGNNLGLSGTVGMTYKCSSQVIDGVIAKVTLYTLMYQPFADDSSDKGNFGEVQVCEQDQPTGKPTTNPQTNNTGMVVGIVIGSLAGVVIIAGGAYFLVKRKAKRDSYKSLE